MQDRHQLLLVESSITDAFRIVTELERAGLKFDFERVETAGYMERALESGAWDFIIFDDPLPEFHWGAALEIYKQKGLDIPFIMMSGTVDDEDAVDRIKGGVHEHVLKDSLARLPMAVKRELRSAQERRIRQHCAAAREYLSSAHCWSGVAIIGAALDGTVISWDAEAERLCGYTISEMIGRSVSVLIPSYDPKEALRVATGNADCKQGDPAEAVSRRKDGVELGLRVVTFPIQDHAGRIIGASIVAQDSLLCRSGGGVDVDCMPDLAAILSPANAVERSRRDLKTAA